MRRRATWTPRRRDLLALGGVLAGEALGGEAFGAGLLCYRAERSSLGMTTAAGHLCRRRGLHLRRQLPDPRLREIPGNADVLRLHGLRLHGQPPPARVSPPVRLDDDAHGRVDTYGVCPPVNVAWTDAWIPPVVHPSTR